MVWISSMKMIVSSALRSSSSSCCSAPRIRRGTSCPPPATRRRANRAACPRWCRERRPLRSAARAPRRWRSCPRPLRRSGSDCFSCGARESAPRARSRIRGRSRGRFSLHAPAGSGLRRTCRASGCLRRPAVPARSSRAGGRAARRAVRRPRSCGGFRPRRRPA